MQALREELEDKSPPDDVILMSSNCLICELHYIGGHVVRKMWLFGGKRGKVSHLEVKEDDIIHARFIDELRAKVVNVEGQRLL